MIGAAKYLAKRAIFSVVRWRRRKQLTSFFYHTVSDHVLPHVRPLYPYKTPAQFEADLVFLKKHYQLISYAQLLQHVQKGVPLPRHSAMLSFDDGLAECFTVVRPLLKKHQIPCTFFVTTDVLDNRAMIYRNVVALCLETYQRKASHEQAVCQKQLGVASVASYLMQLRHEDEADLAEACVAIGVDVPAYLAEKQPYLTKDHIRTLHADGFTIGAHSCTHPLLKLCSPLQREEEIVQSCRAVAELTGQAQVPFAFPFHGDGLDRLELKALRAQHNVLGLWFDTKGFKIDIPDVIQRFGVDLPPRAGYKGSNVWEVLI